VAENSKAAELRATARVVAVLKPPPHADVDAAAAVKTAARLAVGKLAEKPIADLRDAYEALEGAADADQFLSQIRAELADVLGRLAAYAALEDLSSQSLKKRLAEAAATHSVSADDKTKITALLEAV
jgi:hypothetical protein